MFRSSERLATRSKVGFEKSLLQQTCTELKLKKQMSKSKQQLTYRLSTKGPQQLCSLAAKHCRKRLTFARLVTPFESG